MVNVLMLVYFELHFYKARLFFLEHIYIITYAKDILSQWKSILNMLLFSIG